MKLDFVLRYPNGLSSATAPRYWVLVNDKRYCAFDSKSEAKLCIKFFIEDRLVDGSALEIEEEQIETVGGCLYER